MFGGFMSDVSLFMSGGRNYLFIYLFISKMDTYSWVLYTSMSFCIYITTYRISNKIIEWGSLEGFHKTTRGVCSIHIYIEEGNIRKFNSIPDECSIFKTRS